jgi:IS30 family transposase
LAQLGRPGLSSTEKAELWNRWRRGESISDIARALEKAPGSIHGVLSGRGGIAPAERKRAGVALTSNEREEISRGLVAQLSLRAIAAKLGRAPSTISREVSRNGNATRYRATLADDATWDRGRRPKKCRLAQKPKLRALVSSKLQTDWSPQQIAGWLKTKFPDDAELHISHETIYRTLFIQARGALKRELMAHLRSRRLMRRGKNATTKGQPRGRIIDAVSIHDRPANIEDRAIPGHWEGDLLSGSRNSHIATLVERSSRYTILVKIAGKDTQSVVSGLTRQVRKLPKELRKSLTWDRGLELASHANFSIATDVAVYFCDPRSPWQRGSNENTNGLLRQYFPDGTNLSGFSQRDLNRIAQRLNERPRKTLSYRTPTAKLEQLLH